MDPVSLDGHRRLELGAYVLGHLDDDERIELEAHLDGCPDCRVELEQISAVVTLLPKVDLDRLEEPLASGKSAGGKLAAVPPDCGCPRRRRSSWPYRKAMKEAAALEEIERNTGTQFCPMAARALLEVVGCAA